MSDGSTEMKTMLRLSLMTIREQAGAGLSSLDSEDDNALLGALGEMDGAMSNIRNLISARVNSQT